MNAIELGGFALERLLGRGGMADVWLGRHRLNGQPAAIKVITRELARDPRYRAGFKQEVRAVAGLDHPGIVAVLDAGDVSEAMADKTDGRLSGGSPWLAMVLAEHGDLRRLPMPMDWALLREVLLQILDALAHAHARGVIHRDMKPENVLLQVDGDHLRLMLTDFGIAHVIEPGGPGADSVDGQSAGTPQYMAPEQLRGDWRDFGPWTDLYALGCMAFELASGAPPYGGTSPIAIATQHLVGEIPIVAPVRPMPAGFREWVRCLMSREPCERFPTAAHAAYALARLQAPSARVQRAARRAALTRLGDAGEGAETIADVSGSSVGGLALAETGDVQPAMTLATVLDAKAIAALLADRSNSPMGRFDGPPIPPTWYVDAPRRPLLRGVGLGLFGVRAMPFVGRDAERNQLWEALHSVAEHRRPELVVLSGLEGSGKSALAEWFGRRVREVGGAEVAQVGFSPMDAPGDALAAGLDAWFRSAGLEGEVLVERIRCQLAALDPDHATHIAEAVARPLARFIRPDGQGDSTMLAPTERYAAVHGWLSSMSQGRPIVLILDDLQWCTDTMTLAEWLMAHPTPLPVLMVATARADLCSMSQPEGVGLERLRGLERAHSLTIGPLSASEHDEVVEELLGLSCRVSRALRARSAGNPLFALQMMTDWVEDGALHPTDEGYDCDPRAVADMPSNLGALALRRVERLARRFEDGQAVLTLLAIGAALGHAVDEAEWIGAAAKMKIEVPPRLLGALFDSGLAVPGREGWVFGHGYVRGALKHAAKTLDTWVEINRACADSVSTGRAPDERRARHLLDADLADAAIDALLLAARGRMDASEYDRARRICDWRVALMDRHGVAADDVRRAQGMPIRIDALRFMGDSDAATEAFEALSVFPIGPTQPELLADFARLRGSLLYSTGEYERFFSAYQDAIELYRQAGNMRGVTRAQHGQGWCMIFLARYAAAGKAFRHAEDVAVKAGLRIDEGWALHGRAVATLMLEAPGAGPLLEAAGEAFVEARFRAGVASMRVFRAELARQEGRYEDAWADVEGAREIWVSVGSQLTFLAEVVMAGIESDQGQDREAIQRLLKLAGDDGIEALQSHYRTSICAQMALGSVRLGQIEEAIHYVDLLVAERRRTFMHPMARHGLVELAERFSTIGEREAASKTWRLAGDFWRSVDQAQADHFVARADGAA